MAKTQNLYFNNARTTLATSINNSVTSIVVNSIAAFVASLTAGQSFYVSLDDGTNIEICKVTSISGTTLTVVRGQEGTTASSFSSGTTKVENRLTATEISNFVRSQDRMSVLSDVTSLTDPAITDGTSFAIKGANGESNSLVATATTAGVWRLSNYPIVALSGTVGAGSTTTSIAVASANTNLPDTFTAAYIIQFVSGANKGVCRVVSSINTTTVSWVTALPVGLANSDTYEIYRYMGKNVTNAIDANTSAIATLNSNIILKAPLLNPSFSGTPLTPTAATGDNSSQIASTAFVNNEITNVFGAVGINSLAANGYQKFPGGFLIQWGRTASLAAFTPTGYAFPISFTTVYQAVTTTVNGAGNAASHVTALGNSSITIEWLGSGSATVMWIAVGRY